MNLNAHYLSRVISSVCILLLATTLHAQSSTQAGWTALVQNDDALAEQQFQTSLKDSPTDARAWFGLSYTQDMRSDGNSWDSFRSGLRHVPDANPYLYASILTSRMRTQAGAYDKLIEVWKEVVQNPDSLGILRAMAYENLAGLYEQKGDVEQSKQWSDKIGAISTWRLIGPFDNISGSGFERRFDPEIEDEPESSYEGESGRRVRWTEPQVIRNDRWVDLTRYFPTAQGVFYATTYVHVLKTQRVHLRLGTSGSFKVFVDTTLVNQKFDELNNDLDTYISAITLNEGWHRILVKCGASEITRCNFLLRITDEHGIAIPDMQTSTQPQKTTPNALNVAQVENPFIKFFTDAITRNPDHLENYLFLAECYLRNDHATEAEAILRKALKGRENSIVILNLLSEAYQRSDKADESLTTFVQMSTLRPDLARSLIYSYYTAMSANRTDDAELILPKIERALPLSIAYFEAAIAMAAKRGRLQEQNDLQVRAFDHHPEYVQFALSNILMAKAANKREATFTIIKAHLDKNYSAQGLAVLASLYQDAGRMIEWRKTYDRMLELDPDVADYYIAMARVYADAKDYNTALNHVQSALEISPASSYYWTLAATLHRAKSDVARATNAYERALEADPANFTARVALRDVTGRRSPFEFMPSANVDSLIAKAPSAVAYPEASSVVLYEGTRRVVYNGSRCAVMRELLVRVLTTNGIDDYKEYYMRYAGDGELIIEKAVVIKGGGKEIAADQSASLLVFKSLEPGDFVYIRTRVREARVGRLARHFWDEFAFNAFVPVLNSVYSLLLPEGTPLRWLLTNMEQSPTTSPTQYGTLYTWQMNNQQAIEFEEGMPPFEVVAKRLQLTSLEGWDEVVRWYDEIARTKTRSSIEIVEIVDSLFPRSQTFSDRAVLDGVYRFVTSQIRYSNVPFRQSGIVPQKARKVLVSRIGDCKDVATLCIAMLAERNIRAWHVLVETRTSALLPARLPSIPFDHAIVAVELDNAMQFFDLTADNVPSGSLPFADLDAFALPIKDRWKEPIRLSRKLFTPSNVYVETEISIKDDASAMINQHFTHTGARTEFFRTAWKGLSDKERAKQLREGLSQDIGEVFLEDFHVDDLDSLTSTLSYNMRYTAPSYVVEAGEFRIVRVPWYDGFHPDPALSYDDRIHPYEFDVQRDTVTERIRIAIPLGYVQSGLQPTATHIHPAADVTFTSSLKGSQLELTRRSIARRRYVGVDEYRAYKTFFNDVLREDRRSLLLMPKGTVVKAPKKRQ
ncbi:MAG: DUF3857 domain-containing protein [bacterium]|nr:DUF3857 domain-containing protein [bacterium]